VRFNELKTTIGSNENHEIKEDKMHKNLL